jgi:thiamine biosynthesis lipoprotein
MWKKLRYQAILLSILATVVVTVITIFFILINHEEKAYECSDTAMKTDVKQTIYGHNAPEAAKAALKQIKKLETQISWEIAESQVQKINENAANGWVNLSSGMMDILSKSLEVSNLSKGAFDPTIFPISSLWGFGEKNEKVPNKEDILEKLPLVDYKYLKINKDVKRAKLFKKGSGITLDGISKGAACNFAIKQYKENGPYAGIVSIEHSIGVYGEKKDHKPWRIAFEDPFKRTEAGCFGVLEIREGHVFTSDFYEKSFTQDVKIYHKIFNPQTGNPAKKDRIRVTITHNDGIIANALAIACFVLGRENSLPLLSHYAAGAIFVDNDKHVFLTANLEEQFKINNNEFAICDWK